MTATAGSLDGRAPPERTPSPLTGFLGLAVLVVMLQSTGGFTVELLGPDLLLTTAGFAVTYAVLTGIAPRDRAALAGWYREQVALRAPLLVVVLAAVLTLVALRGGADQVARAVARAFAGLWPPSWSQLEPDLGPGGHVDPLGPMWLVGLLVLFSLGWPILLCALRSRLATIDGTDLLGVLAPVLLACAAAAWLVGPLRAVTGADLVGLAMGAHVRVVEWLFGAAAAAAVVGLEAVRAQDGRATSPHTAYARCRWWAPTLAGLGVAILLSMATIATWYPVEWLRFGGPGVAALGAAAVLLALHGPGLERPAAALGRGLPDELGRMAYPLLVLHAPMFWLVQLAVPAARPLALLVVGGALAWLLGLLIQDGLIRRWHARGAGIPRRMVAVVVTVLVAGVTAALNVASSASAEVDPATPGTRPVVLVLGGSTAGELATALDRSSPRFAVVDGSRAGCGLLTAPPVTGPRARTTALAQLPTVTTTCDDWAQSWRAQITADQPHVVVVDLSADAAPRTEPAEPGPCDPAFRQLYRSLVERAVGVWTDGAPTRPVLLATARDNGTDGSVRCLNALVMESAGSYRELARLDVDEQLCPDGTCRTHTLDGEPLLDPNARLSRAGLAEVGTWLDESIAERVDGGPGTIPPG